MQQTVIAAQPPRASVSIETRMLTALSAGFCWCFFADTWHGRDSLRIAYAACLVRVICCQRDCALYIATFSGVCCILSLQRGCVLVPQRCAA